MAVSSHSEKYYWIPEVQDIAVELEKLNEDVRLRKPDAIQHREEFKRSRIAMVEHTRQVFQIHWADSSSTESYTSISISVRNGLI